MAQIHINDLSTEDALDSKQMSAVSGGLNLAANNNVTLLSQVRLQSVHNKFAYSGEGYSTVMCPWAHF